MFMSNNIASSFQNPQITNIASLPRERSRKGENEGMIEGGKEEE
jgi:hypothetical protein